MLSCGERFAPRPARIFTRLMLGFFLLQRPLDAGLLQYATFDVLFLRILAATIQVVLVAFFVL